MRGLKKSKRVTWATNGNLCQVKLFSSEDYPSEVGIGTKINLQLKRKSAILYTEAPPGFEGAQPQTQSLKNKLAGIPLAKWTSPPTFVLSPSWRVASGEESEEVQTQNQRELRVLEAVYPRLSSIPPNPIVSSEVENDSYDDSRTPVVPLTPIEEEEADREVPLDILPSSKGASALVQNPLDTATSTALSSLMSTTTGLGKLIDHELLLKILANPSTLEQLINVQGNPSAPKNTPLLSNPSLIAPIQSATINFNPPSSNVSSKDLSYPFQPNGKPTAPSNAAISAPLQPNGKSPHMHYQHPSPPIITTSAAQPTAPSNAAISAPLQPNGKSSHLHYQHPSPPTSAAQPTAPSNAAISAPLQPNCKSSHMHYQHPQPTVTSNAAIAAPPVKDMNYYKSLIQMHGGTQQQEVIKPQFISHQSGLNLNLASVGKSMPKFTKSCSYFNSLKGCRRGANCAYQHDPSLRKRAGSIVEMQTAKRMKVNVGMRGSQIFS